MNSYDMSFPGTNPNGNGEPGLTKRELFAALALQGLLTKTYYDAEHTAERAVYHADRLIEALNK